MYVYMYVLRLPFLNFKSKSAQSVFPSVKQPMHLSKQTDGRKKCSSPDTKCMEKWKLIILAAEANSGHLAELACDWLLSAPKWVISLLGIGSATLLKGGWWFNQHHRH